MAEHAMAGRQPYTHRVAAAAYVFHSGRVLLLKRSNPPHTFAPPGGKLEIDEPPETGLRREVSEETGLEIEVLGIAHVWYDRIHAYHPPLLCINYIASSESDVVTLSEEHTEFVWADRDQLRSGSPPTRDSEGNGYKVEQLLSAFDLYARLRP